MKGASIMTVTRVLVLATALLAAAVPVHAEISDGVIKIGIMNDQSGTYADLAGPGSVVAAKMAIEDFGAAKKGLKVEVLVADHQNKPDVGSSIARQWFDADKVDVIVDVPTSSVVLAVNQIAREKNKALIVSTGATSDLTGQQFAGLLVFLTDVHALGLEKAQGLLLTESFYWDLNDRTRAFSTRFAERHRQAKPTMAQAGVYSAVLHYLKAVEALKSDDGPKVIAKMKELPTDDPVFGKGMVRADGRKIHPMYLFEVKKPSESRGPWDYYKVRATIPAEQAFRPMDQGNCPLVKK